MEVLDSLFIVVEPRSRGGKKKKHVKALVFLFFFELYVKALVLMSLYIVFFW